MRSPPSQMWKWRLREESSQPQVTQQGGGQLLNEGVGLGPGLKIRFLGHQAQERWAEEELEEEMLAPKDHRLGKSQGPSQTPPGPAR